MLNKFNLFIVVVTENVVKAFARVKNARLLTTYFRFIEKIEMVLLGLIYKKPRIPNWDNCVFVYDSRDEESVVAAACVKSTGKWSPIELSRYTPSIVPKDYGVCWLGVIPFAGHRGPDNYVLVPARYSHKVPVWANVLTEHGTGAIFPCTTTEIVLYRVLNDFFPKSLCEMWAGKSFIVARLMLKEAEFHSVINGYHIYKRCYNYMSFDTPIDLEKPADMDEYLNDMSEASKFIELNTDRVVNGGLDCDVSRLIYKQDHRLPLMRRILLERNQQPILMSTIGYRTYAMTPLR